MPLSRNELPAVSPAGTAAAQGAVIKRLAPGTPGTKRLQDRFGASLVCVRYRLNADEGRRYTTVELLIDDRPVKPRYALVRVSYRETELRQRVKNAGGVWDPARQLWQVPKSQLGKLGLQDHVVGKV